MILDNHFFKMLPSSACKDKIKDGAVLNSYVQCSTLIIKDSVIFNYIILEGCLIP